MDEELIALLSKLVEFDTSINPDKNQFPDPSCRDWLETYAKDKGYEILSLPEANYKGNPVYPLLAVKRGKSSGSNVLFLGHIDVVPVTPEEISSWDTNPFTPTRKGDFLMGRGASDMKGGVAAFFTAFNEMEIEKGNLLIAVSGDEEIGGTGSLPAIIQALKENDLMPDFVINAEPSKDSVLVTQRRGATWLRYTFPIDRKQILGHKKTIEFFSRQGDGSQTLHSASYLFGADIHAMTAAAKFSVDKKIVKVISSSIKNNAVPQKVTLEYVIPDPDGEPIEYSPTLSRIMWNLASVNTMDWPVKRSKFGISVNPNVLQYNPDQTASLTFDIRSMLSDTEGHSILLNSIEEHLNHEIGNVKGEILAQIDPVDVDPNSFLPKLILDVCKKHKYPIYAIGEKLGGASDTRYFTQLNIPGVELGPIGKNDHGINEGVNIASLEKLVDIFRDVFLKLSNS